MGSQHPPRLLDREHGDGTAVYRRLILGTVLFGTKADKVRTDPGKEACW
ncbi:hypothetical protein I545_4870 [Mycobacterium kansasii 662]|uniref:Uncharacterized protein n=1 Tax=Mycobacterium kansasii 662 TaxID=1299326 RepID=X7Z264_MYCKA|nr:hypothetical protein I545_4870 [Mycobacterium kansasii 662]